MPGKLYDNYLYSFHKRLSFILPIFAIQFLIPNFLCVHKKVQLIHTQLIEYEMPLKRQDNWQNYAA